MSGSLADFYPNSPLEIMENTIHSYMDESSLTDIFNKYLASSGSVGIDGMSILDIQKNLPDTIEVIRRKVDNGTYDFSIYKEKLILKGRDSMPRVISIPTNRDKLVLKVLHLLVMQNFADMPQNTRIHSKIADIRNQVMSGRYDSFIKLDIKNFFPSISHEPLLALLREKIADESALRLIEQAITQSTVGAQDTNREKYMNNEGVPQGLSISGLLASIFLTPFDQKHGGRDNYRYYRFVDDILVLCRKEDAGKILQKMKDDMEEMELSLHALSDDPQKSCQGMITDGFQFLGYMFNGQKIGVRPSSLDKIFRGINRVFIEQYKHAEEKDIDELYYRLNLKITGCVVDGKQYGWLYFFSFINDTSLLTKLDNHVKRSCKRYHVPYDPEKIKKFSRTYYELKKKGRSNYIPHFNRGKVSAVSVHGLVEILKHQSKDAPKDVVLDELKSIDPAILGDIEDDIEFY